MSLLDNAMEDFIIMNKVKTDDGYGSTVTTWTEGAHISAAVTFNSSTQALTAQAQGVTSLYTITTRKNVTLEFHDVLKRVRDNKILRVTSDGDDVYTPDTAKLNMRQVTAEEWTLNG